MSPPLRRRSQFDQWVITVAPAGDEPAKNRQSDLSVTVGFNDRVWASTLLAALYKAVGRRKDQRLFGDLTLSSYEAFFRRACRTAKLPVSSIDPHAARHGGPSWDFQTQAADLLTIQARGRRLSSMSVRRYAKSAMLLRQLRKVSPHHLGEALRVSRSLPRLLAQRF